METTTYSPPAAAAGPPHPHEGPVIGDPRACRTTCSYWSDVLGDCILPREDRVCGQRRSRAAEAGEREFHLFGERPVGADSAAALARHWRNITFER